jgi:dissimilatory sulfite reductase (desulfoviridin) alpha/beta subunit
MTGGAIELDESKCNFCGGCVKSCPAEAWSGDPGYIVSFGGTFGNAIAKGEEALPIIRDTDTLFKVTDAAVDFFACRAKLGERFRPAIERAGWDIFKKTMEVAYDG